jgi:dTDP-glucose 4,6-dehydratase
MNNYLITGGAGFIGSYFTKYIFTKEQNANIIVIDKMTYAGDINRIKDLIYNNKIKFIRGDINDSDLIEKIICEEKINRIINFAAESHVDRSIETQREFIESNVMGVQTLLTVSKKVWDKINLEDVLFTQISTDEVYGSSKNNNDYRFNEKDLLNPMNTYSASKASAEHLITAFVNTFNYNANIIRSTNNYGAFQNEEKFIPNIINSVINNNEILVYGDGTNKRCWLNVNDNCRAIYEIVNSKKNEIYNVKGEIELSNINLVKRIIKIFKNDFNTEYESEIKFIEDRKGHDYFYRVDDKKIRTDFDFKIMTSFDEEISKIIKDHLKIK